MATIPAKSSHFFSTAAPRDRAARRLLALDRADIGGLALVAVVDAGEVDAAIDERTRRSEREVGGGWRDEGRRSAEPMTFL
jgi:hypothetical protein